MELAESVETTDAKVWTVKLKSGVEFHDGKTLSSDDVVFSLRRHLDEAVGSQGELDRQAVRRHQGRRPD